MTDTVYTLHRGHRPLLLSLPHVGTHLPDALRPRLVPRALQVEDTDWHLERLYAFARTLGVSVLVPRHSRYVVDLNRPPENTPMYPGVNNTGLCPLTFFSGEPIYQPGQAPDDAEIAQRVGIYWRPYHAALQAELARLQAAHGQAVLFDGHSICSVLPWLFDGRLPDLNLGTASGSACAPALRDALAAVLNSQSAFTVAVDGRFKGGHITRNYGRPADGVHAVQLEMTWRSYMDEAPPWAWNQERAAGVQPLLQRLVETMLAFVESTPRPAAGTPA
jgi:N-formylglutamate deformylase